MTPDEMSVYAVRLSGNVATQTAAALEWMNDTAGIDGAEAWESGLQAAYAVLAALPQRCPIADENRIYQKKHPGPPLRVSLYRHGRATWRLLFTIHEAEDGEPPYVKLHQLRHGAQKPLTKWPDAE